MPKAQGYFENTFSINREIIEYNGLNKPDQEKLEGNLDLKEFKKLKKLDIQGNKITSINLSNCPNLDYLDLGGNPLTNINLTKNNKLKKINFENCPINQNLSIFSHLKNLEHLTINKTSFFGTLKTLSDSKLIDLRVKECSKIEGGWEFLPTTLKKIEKDRDNLFGNLRDYQNNFPAWRKDHDFLLSRISKLEQQLIEQEKITNKVLKEKEQQEKQLASEKETFLTTAGKLNNYISQLEEKLAQTSINKQEAKIEIPPKK
ncbi:10384_t:CDS:1 [Entrophospora sp. SA101]|nr:12186_t:CDS:1 [Entrophospora sp. SA101]CAJ0748983.1 10384_t:CDS:1 [Entrophospora sp. SA101]CAJ0837288.1 3343_t:CDS:1 [Entrophospora sp. SA101]CAJ0841926.1 10681_t:CDS:1 [Entrophospora sp. SA101]